MKNETVPINRLDAKLIELEKSLYLLKSTLDLYKLISLNALAMRRAKAGPVFFGHLQYLSLESYVLGICKVFEQPTTRRKHELHSLCAVVGEAESYPLMSERPLKEFVAKYASTHQSHGNEPSCALEEVRHIYRAFVRQHAKEYARLQGMRDKAIAHPEYLETAKRPRSLPSYDFMEKLLFFAIDLHSAISLAYLNVLAHPIRKEGKVAGSLCSTLRKLGIDTVKTKYDDQ
ncbi:MAG: hypothetical protein JXN61_04105 [Sedimentisphaerales bacterium]|nr:hypothetical protein [Sedimentisphaerales bacterium]